MSTKDTEINRRIDGETAEGHARATMDEAELRTAKKAQKKAPALDAEAEGHVRMKLDQAELRASKRATVRAKLDDEAEGHRVQI